MGPKWQVEKIQGYENLLQGKWLILGVAKKTIYVVATQNDEAIATKRRSLITLEDFRNVHAITIHQLAMVEELLKTTLRSKALSSNVGFLKDFEESICETHDNAHVQFQNDVSFQGMNVCLSGIFWTWFKIFISNQEGMGV